MTAHRVALVTGGAGGIGGAICQALADAGHRVAVADIDADRAAAVAARVGGLGVMMDVVDPRSVTAAAALTARELGPIEIAVSGAGWDQLMPFLQTDEAFTRKVLDLNLTGPIRLCRAVLPGMVEAGWGRVITIASDAGRVGSSLEAVYSAAKGGLIAFTKTIAREFARHGVTANSVCPGPTDTPLLRGIADAGGEHVVAAMTRSVPMRRLGQPTDVAPAVVFLASDEAGYITGQTLSVSGGLTMS